jgi:hypothetical protein
MLSDIVKKTLQKAVGRENGWYSYGSPREGGRGTDMCVIL